MGELFGNLYCALESWFGETLANYLWGEASPLQEGNMFITFGLWNIGITALLLVLYYYVVNHPRFNNLLSWFIVMAFNAVIQFLIGWQVLLQDFYDGLMVEKDSATGKMVDLDILDGDMLAFGATNALYSIVLFFLLSLAMKWWSRNCSNTPF